LPPRSTYGWPGQSSVTLEGINDLKTLAKKLRSYFEVNCRDLELHIVSRFPKNSCETSSLVLGKILCDEFPEKEILLVKGTNTKKYEMHFWVEAGGHTFDITADQFSGIEGPIYGPASSKIYKRFNYIEKMKISEALAINSFATGCTAEFERISKEIRAKK
jgi:hypothetical protein